jgi:hypothetical protein
MKRWYLPLVELICLTTICAAQGFNPPGITINDRWSDVHKFVSLRSQLKVGETQAYSVDVGLTLIDKPIRSRGTIVSQLIGVDSAGNTSMSSTLVLSGTSFDVPKTSSLVTRDAVGGILGVIPESDRKRQIRLQQMLNFVYPDGKVHYGDKWTVQVADDDVKGTVKAEETFQVTGFQEFAHLTVRVNIHYLEQRGDRRLSCDGQAYLNAETGAVELMDLYCYNLPLSAEPCNARLILQLDHTPAPAAVLPDYSSSIVAGGLLVKS